MGFQCRQCNGFLFELLPFVKLDFYISDIAWDSESDRHLENWEWDCIETALWSVTLLLLSPRGIPRPVWSDFGGSKGELGTAAIKDRNCFIVSKAYWVFYKMLTEWILAIYSYWKFLNDDFFLKSTWISWYEIKVVCHSLKEISKMQF